jgi:Uma2 family endonuclease
MATASRLLTYEEWLQMPTVEDGTDEVVKGELRFMPPTRYPHAQVIRRLIKRMDPQLDEAKATILGSNFGLLISREPLTCRSPDIGLYGLETMVVEDGLYCSAPDLIVEVLSPSENRRRKGEKLEDYESIGVPEVWIVSPEAESVEIRMLSGGKLERVAILVDGQFQPTRFPGVSIDVKSIWPEPR